MISQNTKNLIKELLYIIAFFLFFITFGWIAFHIPSSSMEPTLEVGDRLFVAKWSYGYNRYTVPFVKPSFIGEKKLFGSLPDRGDVVVFRKGGIDYIKRVIGLPGDKVQMQEGRLFLNGKRVHRKMIREVKYTSYQDVDITAIEYEEVLPSSVKGGEPVLHRIYERSDTGTYDNYPEIVIPEGYLFMMGDNRDGSSDSRASIGLVKKEYLVGKAQITTFSFYDCDQGKPIYCPIGIPLGRFFNFID